MGSSQRPSCLSRSSSRLSRRELLIQASLGAGGLLLGCSPGIARAFQIPCAFPSSAMQMEMQAAAYAFPLNPAPRHRKCLHELAAQPGGLDKLSAALKAMKDLTTSNPSNPVNWCNQANMHYKHCSDDTGMYLLIHFGWLFLPWHRAYLYFYESILGNLIGDNNFALPYWDWTNNPTVPAAFFDPSSPLYDPRRAITANDSILNDPEVFQTTQQSSIDYITTLPTFSPQNPGDDSFGGPPDNTQADNRFQGALEGGPHDAVHMWVGGNLGDMGDFSTAARDILFFGHHANIDRLWSVWRSNQSHTNPSDPAWTGQWYNFYDPSGSTVSVTSRDTTDATRINVVYDPCPHMPVEAVAAVAGNKPTFVPAGQPVRVTAEVKAQQRAEASPQQAGSVLLQGVDIPANATIRLRVFINKEDATAATSLTDPHYAGTIFVVGMAQDRPGHAMAKHAPRNFRLNVLPQAAPQLRQGASIKITLVPVTQVSTDKNLAAAPPVELKVKAAQVLVGK